MKTIMLLLVALALPAFGQPATTNDLSKIEASLKETPNDPMLHYRKCQALFAGGKEEEAVKHAAVALEKFKAENNPLSWMRLGSINTNGYRLDVHYNMGPKERAEKKDGIVRPYSFRVWTTNSEPTLVRTLDFELAYFKGEVISAAVGETKGGSHSNFGIVDAKSDFATIKKKVLEVIKK